MSKLILLIIGGLLRAGACLTLLLPVSAATLKSEAVKAWDDYINVVNVRIRDHAKSGPGFLWVDESPERAAKVHKGEIVVSAASANMPIEVPEGLIHDWIGAVFIPDTSFDRVFPVVRDYERYKDFYRPTVLASKPVALSDPEDWFSMVLANKSLFRKSALDSDYKSSQFRVDDSRRYTIAETTRIREIADFGTANQHMLPEGEGTGLLWRIFAVTRYQERDGGVYVELEAIALSRDVPGSLRWLIDPIVRRVARASLSESLRQTRDAVYSNSRTRIAQSK